MGLKAVLDSIEGVDDAVRSLYKSGEGGKYVLDVDDYDAHPSVRALKNAFESQKVAFAESKTKLSSAEAKLAELPDDFDAARWLELKAGAEKTKSEKDKEVANLQQLHEARITALTTKHAADIKARDDALAQRDDMIDRTARETELTSLLVKHNIKQELLDGAKLLIGSKVHTNRADDGSRINVVPTNIGDLPLSDFVKGWVDGEGKPYIAAPTGPGATGGTSRAGGSKTISRTEFDKLDPSARVKAMSEGMTLAD